MVHPGEPGAQLGPWGCRGWGPGSACLPSGSRCAATGSFPARKATDMEHDYGAEYIRRQYMAVDSLGHIESIG